MRPQIWKKPYNKTNKLSHKRNVFSSLEVGIVVSGEALNRNQIIIVALVSQYFSMFL